MKTERTASCRCGAVKAIAVGEPARVSVCHCLECKQRSGSAFSYNATYEEAQVRVEGETNSYSRTSDEGRWCTDQFCPSCASIIVYHLEVRPGMVTIPAGNFADPDFPAPRISVYGERRNEWLILAPNFPIKEQ